MTDTPTPTEPDWEWDWIEEAMWCNLHFEYFKKGHCCPECYDDNNPKDDK